MRFVHRDAGGERELEVRFGRPDAVVADLAAVLGGPGGLVIDGREVPAGAPLAGSGFVMGSQVEVTVAAWPQERGAAGYTRRDSRHDTDSTAALGPGLVLRIIGGLDAGLSVPLAP